MNGMTPPVIHRVTALDLRFQPRPWPFAGERRAEIDAHFAIKRAEKPQIWNGRILLARNPEFSGERFAACYFEADFASFLAWRDWGFPDRSVFNGFGMGALRACDGAFILGEMARTPRTPAGSISRRERPISMISGMARSILPAASPARSRRKPALSLRITAPAPIGTASYRGRRSP